MMVGFCIPLMIFHLIGLAIYRGTSWKASTGMTLFVGGAFGTLALIAILSIKNSSELSGVIDPNKLSAFNEYLFGLIVMAVFTGGGAILYLLGRSAARSKTLDVTIIV